MKNNRPVNRFPAKKKEMVFFRSNDSVVGIREKKYAGPFFYRTPLFKNRWLGVFPAALLH